MFNPFDYQEDCLSVLANVRRKGGKKALVVMATALGKTFTAAFDVRQWFTEECTGNKRILYLCHQNDILYQARTKFEAVLGHLKSYGYFHGQSKTMHSVDVLFASFQTMEGSRELFAKDEFAYVIVDESHHSQADSYRSTIEYFEPEFLLAITATPDRLDELDIREIFGPEVFSLPLEEAMAHGYLTPVDYRMLADEILLSQKIETEKGRRNISELNKTIFIPRRDEEIANIIARNIASIQNPQTIIFCSSIKHCNRMAEVIPDSFAIHSAVPEKERAVRTEMFRQGLINTVLVVDSFNEGIDIPAANVLVFLRSTDSRTIFFQQLGRGLRKDEGKESVLVLDFVANCERILMVDCLYQKVKETWERLRKGEGVSFGGDVEPPMTLNWSSVEFQEKIIPILKLLHRSIYPTWREASQAAVSLGITSSSQYRGGAYKSDMRLPGNPRDAYADFPGWDDFLGRERKEFYKTWQEASKAAQALSIPSSAQYQDGKYKGDPKLPFNPVVTYADFPGWVVFLGKAEKDCYETLKEASEAVKKLGIKSILEYKERYKEDPKLHADPSKFYKNFSSWGEFFGTWRVHRKSVETYLLWQDAAVAANKFGITGAPSYRENYKKDPKLPSSPQSRYKEFPGWKEFIAYGVRESLKQKTSS